MKRKIGQKFDSHQVDDVVTIPIPPAYRQLYGSPDVLDPSIDLLVADVEWKKLDNCTGDEIEHFLVHREATRVILDGGYAVRKSRRPSTVQLPECLQTTVQQIHDVLKPICEPPPIDVAISSNRTACLLLSTSGICNGPLIELMLHELAASLCLSYTMVPVDALILSKGKVDDVFQSSIGQSSCLLHMVDVDQLCFGADRRFDHSTFGPVAQSLQSLSDWPREKALIVVGTTSLTLSDLPDPVLDLFLYRFRLSPLTADQRKQLLSEQICQRTKPLPAESISELATFTSSLTIHDLLQLKSIYGRVNSLDEMFSWISAVHRLDKPRTGQIRWTDIGGLDVAKRDIYETLILPFTDGRHTNIDGGRAGLLFHGPPGCGKTLLAKAVANETKMNFISVKGPELLSPYVGQSEGNVRDLFRRARHSRPCVVFFDEIDAFASARGRGIDSGNVSDRIVGALLSEMDGLGPDDGVVVIGATNRPDLLDPALLRPGRFDRRILVDIGSSAEEKAQVLKAITNRWRLGDDVDLSVVARRIGRRCSGADLYGICVRTAMGCLRERIRLIESGSQVDGDLVVNLSHFLDVVADY